MSAASAPSAIADITTASTLLDRRIHDAPPEAWSLAAALGRFVALEFGPGSGTAALSLAAGLIREAQAQQGLAAWIAGPGRIFFPPDFAASGVDLAALPVVRAPDAARAARVADTLLRSGSFALVVFDGDAQALPLGVQTRLAGLAVQYHTALVTLRSPGERSSRGSLVSLRCATGKRRAGHDCFSCELRALKDKRRAPGWTYEELRHGPDGLC
ncbi:MAG: recombinase A [Candidatus Hydrogenedentes bacterium]|nr:recombinase A [Candidatus Hydrogenedentota bacterium]